MLCERYSVSFITKNLEKGERLEKNSQHPFHSQKVYFPTKHHKEKILAPLLAEIGLDCEVASIDTDQFGTFSGEIERTGSVLETLRKKLKAAME